MIGIPILLIYHSSQFFGINDFKIKLKKSELIDEVEMLSDKLDQMLIDSWIESIPVRLREYINFKGVRINY